MSYFKTPYWNDRYWNIYWQQIAEGAAWTVDANATVSWGGQGGLEPDQPEQPTVQPGAGSSRSRRGLREPKPLRPWEAFEPTVLQARATITGTALVEAELTDLNASTSSEVAIDEDDQLILSFVTSFLSEANEGCEIHGYLS